MKLFSTFLFTILLTSIAADVRQDFSYLVSIFQGLYDNIDQYKSDISRHLPPQDRHLHLTTSVAAEEVPVLQGRTSFYLEQYLNGSKDNLIRQRIYSFAIDAMKRINLEIYSLVDQAKFAHAKPNSPLFKNLTAEDIVYAKGCDVYWNRVSNDFFLSHMFNTCIVPIGGAEVLIIDKSTLSPKYLTADETWIFVKNGTILKVYPGPYNMTKQSSLIINGNPPKSLSASTTQLQSFEDILSALISGHQVRYYIKTSECMTHPSNQAHMGGFFDAFEYFKDPKFGPVPHFGFSAFFPQRNESGHLVIRIREGLVYKDGRVDLKLTTLTPDYQTVLKIQNFTCAISQGTESGSALFYSTAASVTQITNFQTFISALQTGAHVRFTVNYGRCNLGVNAVGGGRIEDFEISKDGSIVKTSQYKLITNYQGPGYVDDIVIGSFYSNSSVIFIASDVKVNTDKAYYVEEIDCDIDGLKQNGSVFLYQID